LSQPKTAYILLWFPKPSETFIFREVVNLWKMGLPLEVYSLYGELKTWLSPEMQAVSPRVHRLGIPYLTRAPMDFAYWRKRSPETVRELMRTVPVRKWRSFEVGGENIWAFFAGFTFARMFEEHGIGHIHAPWANGPATAAWIASRLTGIPFSFTGRAVDIYPPDGALEEKIRDAAFVTTENKTNVPYLQQYANGRPEKIISIYNGLSLVNHAEARVPMKPPFQLLAMGRFDRIKAFHVLLEACKLLKEKGLDFHLTLAGEGWRRHWYNRLIHKWGLDGLVSMPGFLSHHKVSLAFQAADVFVMSSAVHRTGERDGLPTVILEALLHRVPVVSTDVCGIAEVVRDGDTGILVPEKNPEALAAGVVRMVSDRNAAIEMAKRGRELVMREFAHEKCHGTFLKLHSEMLRRRVEGVTGPFIPSEITDAPRA
jgi:glycosyltransferase involved in cell wall biosynthesis